MLHNHGRVRACKSLTWLQSSALDCCFIQYYPAVESGTSRQALCPGRGVLARESSSHCQLLWIQVTVVPNWGLLCRCRRCRVRCPSSTACATRRRWGRQGWRYRTPWRSRSRARVSLGESRGVGSHQRGSIGWRFAVFTVLTFHTVHQSKRSCHGSDVFHQRSWRKVVQPR